MWKLRLKAMKSFAEGHPVMDPGLSKVVIFFSMDIWQYLETLFLFFETGFHPVI